MNLLVMTQKPTLPSFTCGQFDDDVDSSSDYDYIPNFGRAMLEGTPKRKNSAFKIVQQKSFDESLNMRTPHRSLEIVGLQ